MEEDTIHKLLGMHPILHFLQPWRKWRLEDIIDPLGPKVAPDPWPIVVAELVSIASLTVAASRAKNVKLQKHAKNRLQAMLDDDDWCPTRPHGFPFPPKRSGTRFEEVVSGLVAAEQSLPDGELRKELGTIIETLASPG